MINQNFNCNHPDVEYQKGLRIYYRGDNINNYYNPFFYFWKHSFERLNFKLVPKQKKNQQESGWTHLEGNSQYDVMISEDSDMIKHLTATIDHKNHNRAIFTHEIGRDITYVSSVGSIIYFDDNGNEICKNICTNSLCTLDMRNGRSTPIFCGDALIYIWRHRDGYNLRLSGVIFNEDHYSNEDPVKFKFELISDHKIGLFHGRDSIKVLSNRWLVVYTNSEKDKKAICFDLESFRLKQDDKGHTDVLYDEMVINLDKNVNDIDAECVKFIDSLSNEVPSYAKTHRNGYPMKCVKCGKDTIAGTLRYNGNTTIGLGLGACDKCLIRYSITNERWECFKVIESTNEWSTQERCDQKVEPPDYCCPGQEEHFELDGEPYQQHPYSQPHCFFRVAKEKNKID